MKLGLIYVAILLLTTVCFSQTGIFQKVVPNPTGENGFEEYVKAADIISDPQFSNLWAQYQLQRPTEMNYLTAAKNLISVFREPLSLIRAGNRKNVFDTREQIVLSTQLWELPFFPLLAELLRAESFVYFSQGKTVEGIASAFEAITFARKMSICSAMHFKLSHTIIMQMTQYLYEHSLQFTLDDVKRIPIENCQKILEINTLKNCLERTYYSHITSLEEFFDEEWWQEVVGSQEFVELAQQLSKMTFLERQEAKTKAASAIRFVNSRVSEIISKPENEWSEVTSPQADRLTDMVLNALISPNDLMRMELQIRTKIRMLSVSAKVLQFRWENAVLPSDLALLKSPDLVRDPVVSREFMIRRFLNMFDIMSGGNSFVPAMSLSGSF